ncbi:trp operon leader peptide [Salmonella enterica]|uniref:trp operon leader peptide n=19 Tax=Salmonella enterica TaxID=28901 RepID=A0A3R0S8E9_SALET|nr:MULTISPECIES: trp operon leader peptide [Salmonella]EAA1041101.1 trp operon leader peptide [Salmonella enterica subsp. enterica serovar Westeinde]EAA1507762.1 trp operon leader peptide [Salmonella enterica subsp. enterica serovar Agama]EAA2458648.1 trp operon leader peptide [Salmonella enterica subsp. enterica serovar Durham]EAA3088160.1 trp operon leader peptide [Salmonella enterica subsp. enterica serovar Telelkebir]EAA4266596.1 trp operon leader peptide [Salmonella enterica subsp. enteri
MAAIFALHGWWRTS